jgi:hypothetical protein
VDPTGPLQRKENGVTRLHNPQLGIVVLVCVLGLNGLASAQFETRAIIPVGGGSIGSSPTAIAVGDFNHDGKLDIAVASDRVQVLLGNGDGTFQPPLNYQAGVGPLSLVAADLNHDGNLDLVVANLESTVSVLLGNGDGTFQPAKNYNTTAMTQFLAVGDFNGDHIPDLVVADSPYVSVMPGNGDGTFQAPIDNATLPTFIPSVAVGDFNGDGKLDVAAAAPNTGFVDVAILMGNGDGTLQPAVHHPVNFGPTSLVAVDLNGDGKLDIAYEGGLGVLLGNGDGTFQPEVDYLVFGEQIVAGDFNHDGKIDLAAAHLAFRAAEVSVSLNNGDGTFQTASTYRAGSEPRFVSTGDFNGDHNLDLIVTDYLHNTVIVLLNTGVVSFSPTSPLNFSPQLVNTSSAPQTVTLTNTATTALSISSIAGQGQFHLSNNTCGGSVAAGANCAISVTFKPLTSGAKSGAITIVDSASTKPQVIELSGVGTVVSLAPTRLTFPPQKVGTSSTPLQVTVTNHGSVALVFSKIYLAGLDYQSFSQTNTCGSQIGPGASCTVSVTFTPKRAATLRGNLILVDTGGDKMQIVPLTGTGTH